MKILKSAVLCTAVLHPILSSNLQASELDSFTKRDVHLQMENSYEKFNDEINNWIDKAIVLANEKNEKSTKKLGSCNAKASDFLVEKVKGFIGSHVRIKNGSAGYKYNVLYRWGKDCKVLDEEYFTAISFDGRGDLPALPVLNCARVKVPYSVYRDFSGFQSISLAMISKFKDTTSYIYNIDDMIVGLDKFAHFANKGRQYFRRYYGLHKETRELTNEADRRAYLLAYNLWAEQSVWGTKSTGVGSYGDLVANFEGMRFYNELVGFGPDFVTGEEVKNPIATCKVKTVKKRGKVKYISVWEKNREFDLRDHLNVGWDEGYNCTLWKNQEMADSVKKRVSEEQIAQNKRTGKAGQNLHCPIDMNKTLDLKNVYGDYYKHLINDKHYPVQHETATDEIGGEPSGDDYAGAARILEEKNGDVLEMIKEIDRRKRARRKSNR